MNHPIRLFKKTFKSKNAVSQVLAAVIMIFLVMTAIGVVWGWLYPGFRNFQATNALNSATSYMLNIDDEIYNTFTDGIGSTRKLTIDPMIGYYFYEPGKNVTMQFHNAAGTYDVTQTEEELGAFNFYMIGRRSSLLPVRDYKYLKGPDYQNNFFINYTTSNTYQGLTNITMFHPESQFYYIELNYRVGLYFWFDQVSNTLSISINLFYLDIRGVSLDIRNFEELNIKYNDSTIIFQDTTNVDDDFYVDGSLLADLSVYERVLNFEKPLTIANYDVSIEVIANQFLLYL